MTNIEEEYLDVLQNIEFAIVSVYHSEQALSDYDVSKILNVLISGYQAELSKRDFPKPNLSSLQERLYESVKHMCEWRLGRVKINKKEKQLQKIKTESISVEEIIACLKRIRKSVETWNKQNGRKGYLDYIDQFLV
jgi:exosortase/archaeosortase